MRIETHIVTWNRADTIHLTVQYYQAFSKVIVHDNFSTDQTRDILEALSAEVRLFGRAGVLDELEYLKVKNHVWKGSDADFVLLVDDDEIIYHPELINVLQRAITNGDTIFKPKGFSIYSNDMPVNKWTEIMTGIPDEKYNKPCCFSPRINEINYAPGCHEAKPRGDLKYNNELILLHYHGVGGVERMIKRHQEYEPRRQKSEFNMRWGCGKEYGFSPESKRQWFKEQLEKSVPFSEAGLL